MSDEAGKIPGAAMLDDIDPDRLAKLPAWARAHLAESRRRARDAEARANAARLATDAGESDAIVDPYDPVPIGLGLGTHVRFVLDGDPLDRLGSEWIECYVDRDRRNPVLYVTTGDMLTVTPQSSNALWIRGRGRAR